MTDEGMRPACILFEAGRVLSVEPFNAEIGSAALLDVGDLWVLPGLIDSHVHINDPGRIEWEGFSTATRAAAAGGYTCLVDMPLNCIPATTDVTALQMKRAAANGNCLVDFAFWGGAVQGNSAHLAPMAKAGVRGFKSFLVHPGIEEFTMVDERDLRAAMPLIAKTGLPLLVHAEDPTVLAARPADRSDPRAYRSYLRSRPDACEIAAIEMMIRLCRESGCRVHIVHLATGAALPILQQARAEGLPITVETCPHYLYFAAESVPYGATEFKCAPPIRSAANRDSLWQGLRDGTIDLIATDHSPCLPELKLRDEGDFFAAWGGIASLSLALPVIWTAARQRGFSIADVVRWMARNTAHLAGLDLKKGRIAPGYDADFVVFDPEESFTVTSADLHFRHPVSPYIGEALQGRVKMTFLRGTPVFQGGKFVDLQPGRECTVSEWTTAS